MNTYPLDPTIATLADQASYWLGMAYFQAGMRSTPEKQVTVPDILAECLLIEQATSCGYLATESRGRSVRHAAISDRLVDPPAKVKPMTDGEKFGLHGKAAA
jgi:hypothetical protein